MRCATLSEKKVLYGDVHLASPALDTLGVRAYFTAVYFDAKKEQAAE
jgi:hypothetical protein